MYPELDYATADDIKQEGAIEISGQDVARVRGKRKPMCLDFNNPEDKEGISIKTYACHGTGGNQHFIFSKFNEIRFSGGHEYCLSHVQGSTSTQSATTKSITE